MGNEKKRMHQGRLVTKEIRIEAEPAAVYDAWADPEGLARWFVDRAEGEASPGSVMTWHFDHMDLHFPVPVVETVPGERFVIGGEIPGRPPFLQEVILSRDGGHTVLRLVNSGFGEGAEWDEEYEGVDSGWAMALATLKHQLERYPGRPRRHLFAMRPLGIDYGKVTPLFMTAEGRARWLGDAELAGGTVLAQTKREVLIAWPQRDAVLGLKAFSLGPGAERAVALDYSSWTGSDTPRDEAVTAFIEAAVDRLVSLF